MGKWFWLRLNFMILGLVLSLYIILTLQKNGLGEKISDALLLAKPSANLQQATVAKFEKLVSLNWCHKPVQYLQRLDTSSKRVENHTNSNLNAWLAANCDLLVAPQAAQERARVFSPVLLIGFVGGQKQILYGDQSGNYRWSNSVFSSAQLDAALTNMERLFSEL